MITGPILPLLVLIWPLALGALAVVLRHRALYVLPFAPLPALLLALAGGLQDETMVPDLLLGAVLQAGREGALLLGMSAALWLAAGVHAQAYLRGTARPAVLAGFWCLTLAGNLGVFIAADVVTFYVAFAAVSLAAFFLVVHEGAKALRAGRVYLILAVGGEACLLLGFMIGAAAADSLMIADIRVALAGAPLGVALLIAGFGIKAGLMPLHVWLPLAHPAAPTPASAVLSGAIVKAGIIGLILFLPEGSGGVLLWLGIGGAFIAALLGLTQAHPKAVLAYSTISQMGLVLAMIGSGAGAAAAFYAMHHGLAKGALFLSVSLSRRWGMAVAGVAALSVAGAPLTGGALVKAAAGLDGWAATALTLSAVTTAMVLTWFLRRLWQVGGKGTGIALWGPSVAMAAAALVTPWVLWGGWSDLPADYAVHTGNIIGAAWPVALGVAIGLLVRLPEVPQGDVLALADWVGRRGGGLLDGPSRAIRALSAVVAEVPGQLAAGGLRLAGLAARGEAGLLKWHRAGLLVAVLAVALVLAGG